MNGQQDFQGMREAASKMRTIVERMHSNLDEASSDIHATTDTWQSNAADHLRSKYGDLSPKFEDFYQAITNYADFLDRTAANYEEFETKNQQQSEEVMTSDYTGQAG